MELRDFLNDIKSLGLGEGNKINLLVNGNPLASL